jgi:hypothetical protein
MDINKIFAELGRLHLEVMQLREQLAQAQAQLSEIGKPPTKIEAPTPNPAA